MWDRQVAFDVTEDDDSYTITAELPGFQAHNVRVEVDEDGRVLTIGGMKRFPLPTEKIYYVSRDFDLSEDADLKRISRTFASGVLTVTIGKTRPRQRRSVSVDERHEATPGWVRSEAEPLTMEIRCRPADWAEIQSFLADLSELYRMAGGSGLWIHARKAEG